MMACRHCRAEEDPLVGLRDLAIINRHYLAVLMERSTVIMAVQDDLKTAVANAVAAMEKAAAALQAGNRGDPNAAAVEAAAADAASQLAAATSALESDIPVSSGSTSAAGTFVSSGGAVSGP